VEEAKKLNREDVFLFHAGLFFVVPLIAGIVVAAFRHVPMAGPKTGGDYAAMVLASIAGPFGAVMVIRSLTRMVRQGLSGAQIVQWCLFMTAFVVFGAGIILGIVGCEKLLEGHPGTHPGWFLLGGVLLAVLGLIGTLLTAPGNSIFWWMAERECPIPPANK